MTTIQVVGKIHDDLGYYKLALRTTIEWLVEVVDDMNYQIMQKRCEELRKFTFPKR